MIIDTDLERSLWYEGENQRSWGNLYFKGVFGPATGIKTESTLCTVNLFIKLQYLYGSVKKKENGKNKTSEEHIYLKKINKSVVLLLNFTRC